MRIFTLHQRVVRTQSDPFLKTLQVLQGAQSRGLNQMRCDIRANERQLAENMTGEEARLRLDLKVSWEQATGLSTRKSVLKCSRDPLDIAADMFVAHRIPRGSLDGHPRGVQRRGFVSFSTEQ